MSSSPDAPALPDAFAAFHALAASRRSVRRFRPDALPEALVTRVLEAAILAPSASNKQPWRFVVVTRRSLVLEAAAAVRRALEALVAELPEASVDAVRAYGDYFTRFEDAPCVVAPICRGPAILSELLAPAAPGELAARLRRLEEDSALASTAMAVMNLLQAAHALGLGASAMTGPLVAAAELKALLGVPERWQLAALVPLGYPDETPSAPGRKELAKVTRWIR